MAARTETLEQSIARRVIDLWRDESGHLDPETIGAAYDQWSHTPTVDMVVRQLEQKLLTWEDVPRLADCEDLRDVLSYLAKQRADRKAVSSAFRGIVTPEVERWFKLEG